MEAALPHKLAYNRALLRNVHRLVVAGIAEADPHFFIHPVKRPRQGGVQHQVLERVRMRPLENAI